MLLQYGGEPKAWDMDAVFVVTYGVSIFPPLPFMLFFFSFTDEEPGEEKGKEIHGSGKNC